MLKFRFFIFLLVFNLALFAGMKSGAAQMHSGFLDVGTPTLPAEFISPVQTATPSEDGSITHEVKANENPYTISQAYGIAEYDLLTINNLGANPVIYPGQKLIIRHANTPTPTADVTITPTPTRTSRPTNTPTRTPTIIPSRTATSIPTEIPTSTPEPFLSIINPVQDPLLIVIGFLAISGAVMMVVGSAMRRRA